MNSGRRIISLLIQYTSCLQKAETEEKWADVKNVLITVCRKEVSAFSAKNIQFLTELNSFLVSIEKL